MASFSTSQRWNSPAINKYRFATAALLFCFTGLMDAATGALIPSIEKYYQIKSGIVSLIFVATAIGAICAAPFVQKVESLLGRSKSYMLAMLFTSVGFGIVIGAPPFPLIVFAYWLIGTATGMILSMTNQFVSNLENGGVLLSYAHGMYGFGGIISPLMATAMISSKIQWSYFYAIPLFFSVVSMVLLGWAFRNYENDPLNQLQLSLHRTASKQSKSPRLILRALRDKTTILGALFILFYQGAEVSISGWVISFLVDHSRGSLSKVGNVTAGFWGGVTVGRFALPHLASKLGVRKSVFGLAIISGALQLLVWLVPNLIVNATAEALVGVCLGPIYPLATTTFKRHCPGQIQLTTLSLIASMGCVGGALVPLVTGQMAQKLGTAVLHPIYLFSIIVVVGTWIFLPKEGKRQDGAEKVEEV